MAHLPAAGFAALPTADQEMEVLLPPTPHSHVIHCLSQPAPHAHIVHTGLPPHAHIVNRGAVVTGLVPHSHIVGTMGKPAGGVPNDTPHGVPRMGASHSCQAAVSLARKPS